MSISDDIKHRIAKLHGTSLFHLPPYMLGERPIRTMIVSEEVRECVTPPWAENWMGQRHSEFRAKLDAFTQGCFLSVAEKPFNKPQESDVARVDPVADEIWDIRCIDPNARIRCFGCFGEKNLFIALTWQYREDICGADEWKEEIDRCKEVWKILFNTIPRFKGATLDDYLTNFYSV